jgi:hypothetical protein
VKAIIQAGGEEDLEETFNYYESLRAGLGHEFIHEFRVRLSECWNIRTLGSRWTKRIDDAACIAFRTEWSTDMRLPPTRLSSSRQCT